MSKFKSTASASYTKEQLALHRDFLQESLAEYQAKSSHQKKMKEQELEREKQRIKQLIDDEKSHKEKQRQSMQKQLDLMYQVNQNMVERHRKDKEAEKVSRKDCWGDNIFFEKFWIERDVGALEPETLPNYQREARQEQAARLHFEGTRAAASFG